MKLDIKTTVADTLTSDLDSWLTEKDGRRTGLLTSIDGSEVMLLLLDTQGGTAELWCAPVPDNSYTSLTLKFPQLHWFERVLWDLFGVVPLQHPRLKPVVIHEEYPQKFYPLRQTEWQDNGHNAVHDEHHFLEVHGAGVWELPVGPIHAGIIEPGHFRFSCLGENIVNLELRLGYVHRGVEKKITEVPWQKAHFVAEAAATDTACANALAHAIAVESLLDLEPPLAVQSLRTIALETERAAMHIADIGGMMTDIGMVGLAATMSRLRGSALNLAQALSGSRFFRAYIVPGGIAAYPTASALLQAQELVVSLKKSLRPVLTMFQENQAAISRMDGIGKLKRSLAAEFGFVGVAARACGVDYDARRHFPHGLYPLKAPPTVLETSGDILACTNVRIRELFASLDLIEELIGTSRFDGNSDRAVTSLPAKLPANKQSCAVVEAFRGELIHLLLTDEQGNIKRYAIKDPSLNNWTMISIMVRDNLIADFPLCNKSLALSYGGNDL
ncbi:MAG: NADH-quinone oxidoreductase subunit C [Candidatus Melainabacteria bacterium]|nr:NADH-quinone oxidoreductase subunit C [Candidatus Melainabacteria bacterium]